MSDSQPIASNEPKFIGALRIGEKTVPVSADSLEILIAKTHDALQGVTTPETVIDVHIEQSHDLPEHRAQLAKSLNRRTGRPKVGGGVQYFEESQQFRTHPDGTVLMHGPLRSPSATMSLTTRMHLLRTLQTDTATPAVRGDMHFKRVSQAAESTHYTPEQFQVLLQTYESLPVNEEISDILVRRLCAAMGACGIKTEESCEGHGASLPRIWFTCPKNKLPILTRALKHLRERWKVEIQGQSHHAASPSALYVLSPEDTYCTASKAAERYPRAIQDLDTLGLTLLQQNQ